MLSYKFKEVVDSTFGRKKLLTRIHAALAPLIPNRYFPYPCVGGKIYLNLKESPIILARVLKWYEVPKTNAIASFLEPGDTFVDVGASKGDFTLLAAKIVGEGGKVLSIEPELENYRWLQKSIHLNCYNNVLLHNIALSDAEGTAQLYLGEESGWHTLLPVHSFRTSRKGEVINVPTRTLDSFLKEANLSKVDVMKVDVEGAELKVLKGAHKTLSNNKDIKLLIDIHPDLIDPEEVCDFLFGLGFSIYQVKYPFDKPARIDANLMEILARRS